MVIFGSFVLLMHILINFIVLHKAIEKWHASLCPKLPLKRIGGVVLDTHFYGIAGSKFNAVSIK